MASGSHTCSGTWADLPIAPTSRPMAAATATPGAHDSTLAKTSVSSHVPTAW